MNALFASALVLLLVASVNAQNPDREALRGIAGMKVTIEALNKDAEEAGVNIEQLKSDVELRLRKATVRVLDDDASALSPFLYVNVHVLKSSALTNLYAIAVEVHFERVGTFEAFTGPSRQFMVTVWDRSMLGIVGRQYLASAVREDVEDVVDLFLNDYLAANPPKSSR